MQFSDMPVGKRIMMGFSVPIVLFCGFGIWLQIAMVKVSEHVLHARNESVTFALCAKDMNLNVTQAQQFLSDISATRAMHGLDDGFQQAAVHRANFHQNLDRFQKMFAAEGDQEGLRKTRALRTGFDSFYERGRKTAQAYIQGGPEAGNPLMGDFDRSSLALQAALEPFVNSQVSEMQAYVDKVEAQATMVRNVALITGLAVIVMSIVVARTTIVSITRPLSRMQATISAVEKHSDFTRTVPVHGNDEVGQTAKAFNQLMNSLREIIQQTRASVDGIASASHALAQSTQQVVSGSQNQSQATATVAASAEEISVAISEIALHSRESEELAEHGQNETRHALDITQESMAGMSRTALAIKESAVNVARLSESSSQISGIVVAIKEIADQTNLLALNAAIEAARAGEQGRGFAVVADEVRKLADRTGKSTEEIRSLIATIQTEIGQAVSTMQAADELATHSVAAAKLASEELEKIGRGGSQINERVKGISNSIKESDIAIRDISIQMERIAQMTEENSAATEGTGNTARQLDELARMLHLSVEKCKV